MCLKIKPWTMRFAAFLVIAAFYVGCDDDNNADVNTLFNNACSSPDPIEDVEWMREFKNSLHDCGCGLSIVQGQYLSETVFYLWRTCPTGVWVLGPPTLYDCSGTIIKKFNDTGKDLDDLKKLTLERIIYTC